MTDSAFQILLLEDRRDIAENINDWFGARGYVVTHIDSSEEAMKLLKDDPTRWTFFISDWSLIGSDTGEPAILLADTLNVPFCVYSGGSCPSYLEEMIGNRWISKMHGPRAIYAQVLDALDRA